MSLAPINGEKKEKRSSNMVKKGWVAMRVGTLEQGNKEGASKFMIPISHLHHPHFRRLLEKVEEIHGFSSEGPLSLPISVDDFLHLRWMVEKEASYYKVVMRLFSSLKSC